MKISLCNNCSFVLFALLTTASIVFAQGPLTPPGAPAPAMKTLDQVEPRTPISALPFTITTSGSYYLTTNLLAAGGLVGISVAASDVTIDLNGFSMIGGAPVLGSAITASGTRTNVAVLNGTIRNWGSSGVALSGTVHCQLKQVRSLNNGSSGLAVGAGSIVRECLAAGNNFTFINAGILAGADSTIENCIASGNISDGIQVSSGCRVQHNRCDDNGSGAGSGAGIHATGSNNRIEGNHVTGADRGLDIDAGGNIVLNNTAKGNTDNYDIAAGNQLNLLLCEIPEAIQWPANVVLAGSLSGAAGTNGITILANDVTIDLAGHTLAGVAGALDGINVSGTRTNITIRNGSFRDWPGDGVDASLAVNSELRDLKASANAGSGLRLGTGGLVNGCTVRTNGADGILTSTGCQVTDCSASLNGGDGIQTSTACTIRGCTALSNAGNGVITSSGCRVTDCSASVNGGDGIVTGAGCTINGCTAYNNSGGGINTANGCSVNNCSAYSNTGIGIEAASGSIVQQCAVNLSGTNGISVTSGSFVSGCVVRNNDGYGIIAVGDDCFIANNNCTSSGPSGIILQGITVSGTRSRVDNNNCINGGISLGGTKNLAIRNTAYSGIGASGTNFVARVVVPSGFDFDSTDPWQNFLY